MSSAPPEFDRPSTRHVGTPEEHAPERDQRRFVVAVLVSCLVLLGAVLALNVTADPFALAGTRVVPTAVENDRGIKLTLIEELKTGPGVLILGSSRARQAEPSVLQKLTGHTGFNAAVTGGTAADAYVFARYAAEVFPRQKRRYVWFVDVGVATNGVNPQLEDDPRAKKYLRGNAQFGLEDVGTYLGTQATAASWRVFRKCVLAKCRPRIRYNPDGSIPHGRLRYLPERTRNLQAAVAKLVQSIRRNPPGAPSVDPRRYVFLERALAYMNARGERPVIVLNPIYPTVLAELEKYGFPQRKASLEYLRKLHRRFDFVLVNCQDIRKWGGSPTNFSNATHVDWLNMRRMLRYIDARSDGALR
ncbi:MAG: hypothetical protein ACRDNX_05345 [Gaiellaceae bacterium]